MKLYNKIQEAINIAAQIAAEKYGPDWEANNGLGCSWHLNPEYTNNSFIDGIYKNCPDGMERLEWRGRRYTNNELPDEKLLAQEFFEDADIDQ